jgi:hypothetical protein
LPTATSTEEWLLIVCLTGPIHPGALRGAGSVA